MASSGNPFSSPPSIESGPVGRSAGVTAGLLPAAYRLVPAVVIAATLLVVWQAVVAGFSLPPALLPAPSAVWRAAVEHRGELVEGFFSTALSATAGLIAAVAIGSLIAVVFSQSHRLRLALFPYVIFLQTVPIVAIAPLLIIWSGYEMRTVIMVTVIVSLFPVINNVTAGLTSIDRGLTDLFRLYGASRGKRLVRLQIPSAVSDLVVGAKTSSGLAVIGAIVAEFFVGSGTDYDGLGTLMTHWQGFVMTDALIAAVFTSTLLGVVLFGGVHLIGRTLLRRWSDG